MSIDGIDLDDLTYEEWRDLIFARPDRMLWSDDPSRLFVYTTRLFWKSDTLLEICSARQLRITLNFLMDSIRFEIWESRVSLETRIDCVRSMLDLFRNVFAKNSLGYVSLLWWDQLRCFNDNQEQGVVDAMVEVMEGILDLASEDCWSSALHGLGHFEHPRRQSIIKRFLTAHPELDDEMRSYAAAAIEGKVL